MTTVPTQPITRADIEALKDQVTLADSENGLELYSYTNCSDSDSELLKNCRGVVFHGDSLILKGFPFTPEFVASDEDSLKEKLQNLIPSTTQVDFYESQEGCVLRLFNHEDKWYLTTRRKLSAEKSRWASRKSFGEYFEEALAWEYANNPRFNTPLTPSETPETVEPQEKEELNTEDIATEIAETEQAEAVPEAETTQLLVRPYTNKFFDTLNKSYQYLFLLRNSEENRIVCDVATDKEPRLYHVGTITDTAGTLEHEYDIGITRPKLITDINSIEQLISNAKLLSPWKLQGIMVFDRKTGEPVCKVLNHEYAYLAELRGNEPSIKFRYLHLRMDPEKNECFRELYPDHVSQMDDQDKYIFEASRIICQAYINKYIKGQRVVVPPAEFAIMREAHNWYKRDGSKRRMSYEVIIEILNKLKPTELNRIIKDYRMGNLENIAEPKPITSKRTYEPKSLLSTIVKSERSA